MAVATSKLTLPQESTLEIHEYDHAYELVRRSPSQWKEKRPDPRKQQRSINSSHICALTVKSRFYAGERLGNVDIQYVPGAPTIFVNDYIDREGNVQPGLRKLYSGQDELMKEPYRRGVAAGIVFVDGYLFLDNFGGKSNRLLLDYVYHHALNTSHPDYKPQRDLNGMLSFKAFRPEATAKAKLINIADEKKAADLFFSIIDSAGNYNLPLLNALMGMYDLGGGLGADAPNQKMQLLVPFYKLNPSKFIQDFNEHTDEVRSATKVAKELGVLVLTSKDAKLKVGAEFTSLMEFKTEKEAEKIEALVYYFLGIEEGKTNYSRMLGETAIKKAEAIK